MTMDDAAIERLVEAARTGDPEAFGALFDHYHAPVYRYVVSRVGRPSDAEDLAQLVFVKALEALPRYEARGVPFGGWLFRLARNVVIDHVRTRREHAPLDLIVERSSGRDGPEGCKKESASGSILRRIISPGINTPTQKSFGTKLQTS
jgi:RNA polymerase sigma factor (sigma-70 family)